MIPDTLLTFTPEADPASEVILDHTETLALHVHDAGESAMVRLSAADARRLAGALLLGAGRLDRGPGS